MFEITKCKECRATESSRFRLLKNEKWRQAEENGLTKVTWVEGNILYNLCYMNLVKNPLQRLKKSTKRVKVSVEEVDLNRNEIETTEEVTNQDVEAVMEDVEDVGPFGLIGAIETMARTFYERKHVKKEGPIYSYNELRGVFQADKNFNNFLDQLYLVAKPLERSDKTMNRMKKLIVHICYLLALLNNTKINSFKFNLAYYLDSVGTSNEGLNTLANIGITTTARAVDRKKKQLSESHGKYVEKALENCSEKALRTTIITNPCSMLAIPRNRALNPKVVNDELILKYLDERFIENLGVSYHDRRQSYLGECSDDELIERLTLHSYNDRLAEKKSDRHIQNAILFDFVEGNLKGIKNYTKALQVMYDQESMQKGFVTIRKPFTTVFCDYVHCDSNYSVDGKVLACGHGYHNHCLEKCQSKCLICLDYLRNEIKKNIGTLKVSLTKELNEKEFADERTGNIAESDIDDANTATDNMEIVENLLEEAKKSFFAL
ncbi:34709_t:CDS:2 [Gigaspora margarita]|uniref:34709_t:CDS:1 n=1 Tax=Gigaspora margarita TaxID=4874 RepID=A0ABN7W3E7_GIGMA|nr:34709_t:CDS:2 [Gigaspora margarita]